MSVQDSTNRPPIAVVGVSALFPGSLDATGFWRDILAGSDLIGDVPETHWRVDDYYDPDPRAPDKTYAKRGAFLKDVDFDALGWGVPPNIVPATDTAQLLALIVAQRVLDDATGGRFTEMDRSRTSVILGVTSAQELLASMVSRLQRPVWVKALRESGVPESEVTAICERISDHYVPWQESTFPGVLGNVVAGRIANRLDLGGTNCVTDAACASTFSAMSMAVNELYLGQSDLVITGGVDTMNDIFMYMCFSKTPALSQSGDCRPFSDAADGTMLGEGLGMVALKRLDDAERDGDRIYAVVRGVGASSDGRSKSVYAPLPEGQAKALDRAYHAAGYGPETVELVEAHGTGTMAGDAAELAGLRTVFEATGREDTGWCSLGTVKSQIGHTKAAAGAAGLFKTVMALHHKVLPPTIKVDRPNPKLGIEDSPFVLNTRARPWVRASDHPRRASVSSFGFGGSNFHVALEEYTGANPAPRLRSFDTELVLLSAASAEALAAEAKGLAQDDLLDLRWTAWRTQDTFDATAAHRLSITAESADALRTKLELAAKTIESKNAAFETPTGIIYATGAALGDVALLFPGQGSQYVDMGTELCAAFDDVRAVWDRAASVDAVAGLAERAFPKPEFDETKKAAQADALTATEWAQPAIGCTSAAMLSMVRALGVTPTAVAGHSYGELTALHAAGAMSEAAFLEVSKTRGALMAEAAERCEAGAMLAVSAPIDDLRTTLAELGTGAVVANHNGPKQVVLSGAAAEIETVRATLESRGVRARALNVATAFHSPIVRDAAGPFADQLAKVEFAKPQVPVYANTTAEPYSDDLVALRAQLAQQLAEPVRFVEQIEAMYAAGARVFLEVGPGVVLTRLVGAILEGRPHVAVSLDKKGSGGVTGLMAAAGKLACAGVSLAFAALWAGYAVPVDPASRPKPKLTLPIGGANYGKPYPQPGVAYPAPNPERTPPEPMVVEKIVETVVEKIIEVPVAAAPSPAQPPAIAATALAPATPQMQTMAPAPSVQTAWLDTFAEAQRQTASAHAAYQQAMADAHTAYLQTAQNGVFGLTSLIGASASVQPILQPSLQIPATPVNVVAEQLGQAHAHAATPSITGPTSFVPQQPGHVGVHADAPVQTAPAAASGQPLAAAPAAAANITDPNPTDTVASPAAVDATPASAANGRSPAGTADLTAIMLAVVADKTGYPADMLNPDMDLEGDLGVDSIKRVEILSEVRERAPHLPDVDPAELAKLRTLGQIAERFGADETPVAAAPVAAAPAVNIDLTAIMLAVVAEKTGYPAEMLNPDMDLEGDLGVDSIKRVEILSEVRERAPHLPDVDPAELAKLRTLGQIAERFGADATPVASATTSAAPVAAASPAPPTKKRAPLGRWVLECVEAPPLGMAQPGLRSAPEVLITDDGMGVAPALAGALGSRGVSARIVTSVPSGAEALVLLDGLRDVSSPADAIAINRAAFRAARALAPTARAFITVQDTGADFGLSGTCGDRAYLGGLAGLAKTAALEWSDATVRALDIERGARAPTAIAEQLATELLFGGPQLEVGLHADGRRTTLRSAPVEVHADAPALPRGAVGVASGGARGVTAATLIELARKTGCKLALLGRTRLEADPFPDAADEPSLQRAVIAASRAAGERLTPVAVKSRVRAVLAGREIRSTIATIESVGGEARYVSVDVTNATNVAAALDEVRAAWGPIDALVHGAGVIADKLIADKTDEQFDFVFDTKIEGLLALLSATSSDPLKSICFFSSVSGRCGNPGQVDYSMANEILNKVAGAERRRRGITVKSLNWGPWAGGMVSPELEAMFESRGVALIPLEVGAKMLVDELSSPSDAVEVVLGTAPRSEALLFDGTARTVSLDVIVDRASHPHLESHAIDGVVVVPVVMALEWFARAAGAYRPDLQLAGLSNLEVLKGIRLTKYDGTGDHLVVRCKQVSNGDGATLALELLGNDGAKHYTATARMVQLRDEPRSSTPPPQIDAWGSEPVYGDVLFHGPDFQVIDAVEGVSDAGGAAKLRGVRQLDWPDESWRTDSAALDGCLQVALLWSNRVLDGATLPTSISRVNTWTDEPPTGAVRCVLTGQNTQRDHAVCDVTLLGEDDTPLVELQGVKTHLLPNWSRRSGGAS